MDYFLIVILGIIVISVWRSGRRAAERLSGEIHILEREVNWLREQLSTLIKSQSASSAIAPEAPPAMPPKPEPKLAPSSTPPESAPKPVAPPPVQPHAAPAAAPVAAEPAEAASFFSLEQRLGANWLNKLGISILV